MPVKSKCIYQTVCTSLHQVKSLFEHGRIVQRIYADRSFLNYHHQLLQFCNILLFASVKM